MFSVSTLTIGDVGIVLRPVVSSAQLRDTLDAIESIKGIDRVTVDRLHDDTAHVRAHAARPVALASELRAALRRRVVSCTAVDGSLTVVLAPGAATGSPGADAGARRQDAADDPSSSENSRAADGRSRPGWFGRTPPSDRGAPEHDRPAVPSDRDARQHQDRPRDLAAELLARDEDASLFLFDRQHRVTGVAGGLHVRCGYDVAQMLGRTAEDLLPAGTWQLVRAGYADALAGRTRTMDVSAPTGAGTVEVAFRPHLRGGEVVGGVVVVRDVTRQRATDRALAEAAAVLTVVIDRSDTAFGLLVPDGRWARANPAMLELLGRDEPTLLTSYLFDHLHPDDIRTLEGPLTDMIDARCDHHVEHLRVRHRSGDWIHVNTRLSAVRTATGFHGVVLELRRRVVAGVPL